MKHLKKPNKKHKVIKVISLIVILLAGIILAGTFFLKSKLDKIQTVAIPKDPAELGIDTEKFSPATGTDIKTPDTKSTDITNILLLGVDSRDVASDAGRSDSIIIFTIDKAHNKIKLTSILRDSLVSIDGHGEEKITHAHAYGGALLTLKTVNENYKLNIMDYVQVNFFGLEKIIDYLGGVPINITGPEIPVANNYIKEMSGIEKKPSTFITSSGLQNLNGIQAVAYARIRYVGNGDFERSDRQRTILEALFNKLLKTNLVDIPKVLDIISPYIETSLKTDAIVDDAAYILLHNMADVEQQRIPYDDLYKGAIKNGLYVEEWDKGPTIERLHNFIFETAG